MFMLDEETGKMTVRQGDSFTFKVEGVDDSYLLYFSVYNAKREILWEISVNPVDGVATFNVTPAQSTQMTVPSGKKTENYYYGLKRCKNGEEDTLIVDDKNVSDLNKILVYPLIVEGDENVTE